jgi:uncharacterized protein YfaS (alpha-2-macroglobulin family)
MMFVVLICGVVSGLNAAKSDYYDMTWKEIAQLEQQGLPKSMAVKVDSLYQKAVQDNRIDQQIKALIYQLKIQQSVEEFSAQKAIVKVKQQLETASGPTAAIMHSMLAQLYWSYYQNNRWRYSQRGETVGFTMEDIATWDLKTISKETIREYQLSLQNPTELQQYAITDFDAILNQSRNFGNLLRPTLYDFLAHRALDFYINDESGLTMPAEEFSLTDSKYFQPAGSFAQMTITSPDSLSLKYRALLLYQDVIRFHLADKDPQALVEVNLERLDFVYANCALPTPEQYYEAALRLVQSTYQASDASAFASFKLASLYNALGNKYNPEISEAYRWYYRDAIEICRQAIDRYPNSFGGQSCSALMQSIKTPQLNLTAEQYVIPKTPVKVQISVKNLSGVKLLIYRIPLQSIRDNDNNNDDYRWSEHNNEQLKAQMKKAPLGSVTYDISNEGDYRIHSYEVPVQALPTGKYIVIASNIADPEFAKDTILGYGIIYSTNISYVKSKNEEHNIMIMSRDSGSPLAGAEVKLYTYNYGINKAIYTLAWTGSSNSEGMVILPQSRNYSRQRISIQSAKDSLYIFDYYARNYNFTANKRNNNILFTDRAIYRPGQTVYLKGIVYQTDGEKYYKLLTNHTVFLNLRDVNNQEIHKQTVVTNEYGTFNCSFTLPKDVLTGEMNIRSSYGSVRFSVEEYKRPRFEVVIERPKASYKLNQVVTVKATATSYAGFPIDNANVKYRIIRQPKYPYWFWWWGPSPENPAKEIAHGTAQTDAKGEFDLTFLASGDEMVMSAYSPYFVFTITADVSDISGETRSGTISISIGEKELLLNPDMTEYVDVHDKRLQIPIYSTNLNGEPIAINGDFRISRLQAPDHIQKSRLWSAPDRNYLERDEFLKLFPHDIYSSEDRITQWKTLETVLSGNFSTPEDKELVINSIDKWTPGMYILEVSASYKQQLIKSTRYFRVYNSVAKELPYLMADWFVPIKVSCEPGENAEILLGSSYGNTSVLYEIEKEHKIVYSKRIVLNNEQRLFTIPVTENDRGGFYVHFSYVKDGRLYTHDQFINVPWTNKELEFEYMTFRDKLLPGQNEEWRIKIKDHTGGKVTAEVLASMYDASLDSFRSNDWVWNVYNNISMTKGWDNPGLSAPVSFRMDYYGKYPVYPNKSFSSMNWFGYAINDYRYQARPGVDLREKGTTLYQKSAGSSREVETESLSDKGVSDALDVVAMAEAGVSGSANVETPPEDLSGVQARSNFAETAFFYPELRTDEQGEVSIVFTVPEALTRWNFRALAVTKDLQIGQTQNKTVTQKPLMVLPNAPRFFREGDKIFFSTKISSLDESDQSGKCQLFLFDAITMTPVDKEFGLTNAQQSFFVKKGESTVITWELSIPFGINAVTYRVVARAGDFSDGEENTLPILSNRMLVTESLPLPVKGNSTKSFVFRKLRDSGNSTTLRNHKLTLEYTSNPAWYAVQALPYMMEYPYDCNEQTFSRFYANSLAMHIANSNPRIKRVFESWRDTPSSTALLSNLEKNQELKSVLLQETPWVLDAKNEAQNKQRIGLLFDLNNMAEQFDKSLHKLQKNQYSNGAWPWFAGMKESWWVTQYIVSGFGHLDHLGVKEIRKDARVWKMVTNAIGYIDRQILLDYENIKKYGHLDTDNLGYMEMHYLYTRSFFTDISIPADVKVAVDYFKNQTGKYWLNKSLYGQGMIALSQHRTGDKTVPRTIIASLKERALHDEELGMWWKNESGWYWYQAPIETQSLLIEAFNDVAGDITSIDEMRTWLLKQKQTTNWKTTKATAEACYALLLSGMEWLNTEQLAQITIGGNKLDPMKLEGTKVEAGTGYFKTSWSGSDIKSNMANVSVTNPNRVSSWGALYWQYFEDLDKITAAETPLKLNKKLFIERITDTGKVLDPVSDKSQLAIGDLVIVRIELRSDREMEYIHMKDMRSAGFEPINVLSRYKWQDGLGYYEATGDAATNFFIEYLPKGTFVFEYPLRVTNKGDFSNGITTIQCMYAPEFTAHSEGIRVKVK